MKEPIFWLHISSFTHLFREELSYKEREIVGKKCPQSLVAVQVVNCREEKKTVYVSDDAITADLKVRVKIEKEPEGFFCVVSFPDEIAVDKNKITVPKRNISGASKS